MRNSIWRKVKDLRFFELKLKAIKDELGKRDFFDISTEKLIELLVKYYGILKQEKKDTIFKIKTGIPEDFDFDGIKSIVV